MPPPPDGPASRPTLPASPLDGDWQLVAADKLEVRPAHLKITGPLFGADAGCNKIGGGIQLLEGERLRITEGPSTLMGCPDKYDNHFMAALSSAYAYKLSPTHLTLFTGFGQVTFARLEARAQLKGLWRVTALNNGRNALVSSINQPEQFVVFGQDERISGHDGCNSIGGEYTLQGSNISISSYPITKKRCGYADTQWDRAFHAALASATRLELSVNRITLRDATGGQEMVLQQR